MSDNQKELEHKDRLILQSCADELGKMIRTMHYQGSSPRLSNFQRLIKDALDTASQGQIPESTFNWVKEGLHDNGRGGQLSPDQVQTSINLMGAKLVQMEKHYNATPELLSSIEDDIKVLKQFASAETPADLHKVAVEHQSARRAKEEAAVAARWTAMEKIRAEDAKEKPGTLLEEQVTHAKNQMTFIARMVNIGGMSTHCRPGEFSSAVHEVSQVLGSGTLANSEARLLREIMPEEGKWEKVKAILSEMCPEDRRDQFDLATQTFGKLMKAETPDDFARVGEDYQVNIGKLSMNRAAEKEPVVADLVAAPAVKASVSQGNDMPSTSKDDLDIN